MSKVRIVIGKSNSNYATNLDFALAIKSYADEHYSGLIKDIYMGSGHYNQALSKTALLFEMGTYLVEKELVLESTEYLATVVDKTLFSTIVEDENTLSIVDEVEATNSENVINNILNEIDAENKTKASTRDTKLIYIIVVASLVLTFFIFFRKKRKIKYSK